MFEFKLLSDKAAIESEIEQLKILRDNINSDNVDRAKTAALEDNREALKLEISELQMELTQVKNKKKIEEEDIQHHLKLATERNEISLEKAVMANDKKTVNAIAKVKDDYRDKMESRQENELKTIKEMYTQILELVPNLKATMHLREDRKG